MIPTTLILLSPQKLSVMFHHMAIPTPGNKGVNVIPHSTSRGVKRCSSYNHYDTPTPRVHSNNN